MNKSQKTYTEQLPICFFYKLIIYCQNYIIIKPRNNDENFVKETTVIAYENVENDASNENDANVNPRKKNILKLEKDDDEKINDRKNANDVMQKHYLIRDADELEWQKLKKNEKEFAFGNEYKNDVSKIKNKNQKKETGEEN